MNNESGEGELVGILILAALALALLGGYQFVKSLIGGEAEGTVKYEDCRQIIRIKQRDLSTIGKDFVCDTTRTITGKLMEATCAAVTVADGKCEKAIVYQKKTNVTCPADFPYLSANDNCYRDWCSGCVNTTEK